MKLLSTSSPSHSYQRLHPWLTHSSSSPTTLQSSLLNFTPTTHLHFTTFHLPTHFFRHAVPTHNFEFDESDGDYDGFKRRRRRRRGGGRSGRMSKKKRRWWSDEEMEGGIVDQVVDNLWILQVFKSYGLFLPIILISLLLSTGPKAFLMGSGIPFGLSVLVFAFRKLSDWLDYSPKPRQRRRTRSRFKGKVGVYMEDEDDQREESQPDLRTKRRGYPAWGTQDKRTVYSRNASSTGGVNSFGGWDELVTEDEIESLSGPAQTQVPTEIVNEKKQSSSLNEKEMPLLLKLLVAVFPFLGSWTSLF